MFRALMCSTPVLCLLAPPLMAHDDHGHRHADAHVHGKADLTAARDGSQLVVEVRSPVWNILGFEHAPETEDQKQDLERARAALLDAATVLRTSPQAGCSVQETSLHLGESDDHDHQSAHDHDASFRDMTVTYTYQCARPGELTSLELTLFDTFHRLETVEAAFVSETAQKAATLDKTSNVIDVR